MNKNLLFILLLGAFHTIEAGKTRKDLVYCISRKPTKPLPLDEVLSLVEEKKYQDALEGLPCRRPRNFSMGAILKLAHIQETLKQNNAPRKLKRAVDHLLAKEDKALIKKLVEEAQDDKEWEILSILSEEDLFNEGFLLVEEEDDEDDEWEEVTPVSEQ
jgi:hypothetical protein